MSLSENRTHVMKMNSSINYLADLAKHDDVCSILWKTNDSCKTCNYLQSQLSLNGICEVKCKIEQKIIDWAVLLANESIKQLIRPWVNLPRGVKKKKKTGQWEYIYIAHYFFWMILKCTIVLKIHQVTLVSRTSLKKTVNWFFRLIAF